MHDFNRRKLLFALSAMALPLPGCATTVAPLCPGDSVVSDLRAPLTIDTHAHIFNGSDLQIGAFLTQVVVADGEDELSGFVKVMGSIMQWIAWQKAPGAADERAALSRYRNALQSCQKSAEPLRTASEPAFEEGYRRGLAQLRRAAELQHGTPGGAATLGPTLGSIGIGTAIDALPPTYKEFAGERVAGVGILSSDPTMRGYLDFVLHHFNHRHVNAVDYLLTYSKNSPRKIDLLVPSMVDYDYWLARGKKTATTLGDQVDLMAQISVLLGGRVHGFAPFCPFREAMTVGPSGTDGDSLRLVKRAVEEQGFLGVKIYPPMGFAPWGNEPIDHTWTNKDRLLPAARQAGFGKRLDKALKGLYDWCLLKNVPIMAHANASNSPYADFKELASSSYWDQALKAFPGLRVSFGHFGDTDFDDHAGDRSVPYLDLMTQGDTTRGRNVFADTGFFAGVLGRPVESAAVLDALYRKYPLLAQRLMYGTDWTMILPQKKVERYLGEFIGVIDRVDASRLAAAPASASLAGPFFGSNAVEYLGLSKGRPSRVRLDTFYEKNKVSTPDWLRKIG